MSVRQGGNTIAGTGYTKSEIDTIASGKANVALDNITSAGKEVCANLSMPSGTYTNLTLGASGTSYTAPADGYVCFYMSQPGPHDLQVYLSNETAQLRVRTYQNVNDIACWIPVSKGDTFYLEYTYNSGSYQFRFIYSQGEA